MSPKKKSVKKGLIPASTSRPHYFSGAQLKEEDFTQEPQYHRPKYQAKKKKKKPGRKYILKNFLFWDDF